MNRKPFDLPINDHLSVVRRDLPRVHRVELDLVIGDTVVLTVDAQDAEASLEALYEEALQLLASSVLSLAYQIVWSGSPLGERNGSLAVFLRDEVPLQFLETVRACAVLTAVSDAALHAVNGEDWA
jgi:hypothetical protein